MKQNYKSHIYNKLNYMYGIMTEKVYVSTETYIAYNDLTSDDNQPLVSAAKPLITTRYEISNFDNRLIHEEKNSPKTDIINRMNVPTQEMKHDNGKLLCM